MDENRHSIKLYMEAAHEALEGADYNYQGRYWGIAVNRIYYAFFYAASALLLTKDIVRSKHSAILAAFREHFIKTGRLDISFSDSFGQAFAARQIADYEMMGNVTQEQAQRLLEKAKAFFQEVTNYLTQAGY
jgi:uncharacterized protein (UPF0332 family)